MISLPWPPATLSGHNSGHWRARNAVIAKHREWARLATLEARPVVSGKGDIKIRVTFTPPDNRGDRLNFGIRAKPYFDGVAEALKVNDKRFLPEYIYLPADKRTAGVAIEVGQ